MPAGPRQAGGGDTGTLTDVPNEEPHASAYQGALEGEVAIIRFS